MEISIDAAQISAFNGTKEILSVDGLRIVGRRIGIVGPSGSGKSTFLNLLSGAIDLLPLTWEGRIEIQGKRIDHLTAGVRREYLSSVFSRIYPEPAYMLCAGRKIGPNARILLDKTGIASFKELLLTAGLDYRHIRRRFPEQLSGGERQWIGMAIGFSRANRILLLDEPTTSLQKSIRKRLSKYLRSGEREFIIVTHDREFLAELKLDEIYTMENGKLHKGTQVGVSGLNADHNHRKDKDAEPSGTAGLCLETNNLCQGYYIRGALLPSRKEVLADISFRFTEGSSALIEGDNGSGKTTFFKALLRVLNDTRGKILFTKKDGTSIEMVRFNPNGYRSDTRWMRPLRHKLQWVTQESADAFDPAMTFRQSYSQIASAVRDSEYQEKIERLLSSFDLPKSILEKRASAVSSGERKRLDLIRALALDPEVLILDEPFNHLDDMVIEKLREYLRGKTSNRRLLLVSTHIYRNILDVKQEEQIRK